MIGEPTGTVVDGKCPTTPRSITNPTGMAAASDSNKNPGRSRSDLTMSQAARRLVQGIDVGLSRNTEDRDDYHEGDQSINGPTGDLGRHLELPLCFLKVV